jgi:hypothetical protein
LMRQMLIWAGIGIMFGFFIGANNVAHIGGLLAGGALGFVLEPDSPSTARSAARWNAAAIACIGLVAVSFVMAGRVYGTEQEKSNTRELTQRRHQSAYELAQVVKRARLTVAESFDLNREPGRLTRNAAIETASQLRRVAGELEKTPVFDDRSTAIKTRLIELINKRAKSFDEAVNDQMLAVAVSADLDAFAAAFKDFSAWESDAALEFERLEQR